MNFDFHLFHPSISVCRAPGAAARSNSLLGALLTATVLLTTGCGNSVLDFRNADVSNGKIYKEGADVGFTGTVTNVPADKVFGEQPGIQRLAQTMAAVADSLTANDPLRRTTSLCDVKVAKGVLDGAVTCHAAQGGGLRYKGTFEDGALEGPFTWYARAPGDVVLATVAFKDGLLEGTQEMFNAKTQKRTNRLHWRQGKVEGEEEVWHPETGQQIALLHYKNDKLDGLAQRWSADGKTVTYRATLAGGMHNGVEEHFSAETGKPLLRTEWSEGKKNGRFQEWDAQGNLVEEGVYHNDIKEWKPVASKATDLINMASAANKEACAQAGAAYDAKADSRQGASLNDGEELQAACAPEGKRPS